MSSAALIKAVRESDVQQLKILISAGASLDCLDEECGDCLLAVAASEGNIEVVRALLEGGADPNFMETVTPAIVNAARRGSAHLVELLLDFDAEVDLQDEDGQTSLITAAAGGFAEIVEILIEAGANPKHKDEYRKTPLQYAAERGDSRVFNLLAPLSTSAVRRDALLTLKYANQGSPSEEVIAFFKAAEMGDLDGVSNYLDSGGDVDAVDKGGQTALFSAAWRGKDDVVDLLISRGANVNHLAAGGASALDSSLYLHKYGTFMRLFQHAEKSLRKRFEKEILSISRAAKRQNELIPLLEDCSVDAATQAFHEAARRGKRAVVDAFLDRGGGADAMDGEGNTALFYAAAGGQLEILKALLDRGADVNHMNVKGGFPLLAAANCGEGDAYDLLYSLTAAELLPDAELTKKRTYTRARWKQGGRIQIP